MPLQGFKVVVDKNKKPEQYIAEAEQIYIIPQLVREKFPDLVKLIYETESMNDEEREYWLKIMPIMTEEQIVKFRNILVNEKEQLTKLDKEYEKDINRMNQKHVQEFDEVKMKEKLKTLKDEESKDQKSEAQAEEDVLKKLQNL
ncbi:MAG: hypothetical protein WC269_05290 [Candidatus Gracilibacteria bacterium]|jgi:hypothetical protein